MQLALPFTPDAQAASAQRGRILERLQRGPATNVELCAMCCNPRARVSELRKLGYAIVVKPGAKRVNIYTLES